MARATSSLRWVPNEVASARTEAASRSPTTSSARSTLVFSRPRSLTTWTRFSSRVSWPMRAGTCPMKLTEGRVAYTSFDRRSAPRSLPRPVSRRVRDATVLNNVVLPEPFGPEMPATCPASTARSMSRRIGRPPRETPAPTSSMSGATSRVSCTARRVSSRNRFGSHRERRS